MCWWSWSSCQNQFTDVKHWCSEAIKSRAEYQTWAVWLETALNIIMKCIHRSFLSAELRSPHHCVFVFRLLSIYTCVCVWESWVCIYFVVCLFLLYISVCSDIFRVYKPNLLSCCETFSILFSLCKATGFIFKWVGFHLCTVGLIRGCNAGMESPFQLEHFATVLLVYFIGVTFVWRKCSLANGS